MHSVPTDLLPFEVDMGGYRIGEERPFFAESVDFGALDWRTQDQNRPGRDGVMFGRDFATPGVVVLTLVSMAESTAQVRDDMRVLSSAWRWVDDRANPGAYTWLAYESGGEVSVLYGRPRKIAPEVSGGALHQGGTKITCEFAPMDSLVYSGREGSLQLVIQPMDPPGLEFPAEAPFDFTGGQEPRQGQITVGGFEPTPIRVEVRGPITDPRVWSSSGGWMVDVRTTVGYDQTLVIDTLANTVKVDGASVAAKVTHSSDLNARLRPGVQEVFFAGNDSTRTSTATFAWRDAHIGY